MGKKIFRLKLLTHNQRKIMSKNLQKLFFIVIIFFTTNFIVSSQTDSSRNPIIRDIYTADPSAHVWQDGRLYIYPSHDVAPPQGCDLQRRGR